MSESPSAGGGGGGGKAVQRLDSPSYTNTLENVKRLMDAQDFQAALASLDSLATQNLNSGQQSQVAILRARLLIALNRSDEASRTYSTLLNSADDPAVLREAASRLFILSRDSGNLQGLLSEQTERLKKEPANANALYTSALLYQYSGDIRNELLTREALARVSTDAENTSRLAQLYSQTGANENAAAALGRLAELRPDGKGHLLARKAESELAAGTTESAIATAREGLQLERIPDSTAFKLAHVFVTAGRTQEAATVFEQFASRAQTQEGKDRFLLEACRNRLAVSAQDSHALEVLGRLNQSSTEYVRKEAEKLLSQKR
jgi:tetratricopeptide (TPR) repeat protein